MAVSAGVQVIPLSAETTRQSSFTHAAVIPYTTVATIGTTGTTAVVVIADLVAGDVVSDRIASVVTEAWTDSDASLNSVIIRVGETDTDRFLVDTEIGEDGTEVDYFHALGGSTGATSTAPLAFSTTDTLDCLFTVAGGANPTCAELTAGKVVILFTLFNISKIARGCV